MWAIEDSPGSKVAYRGGWYHFTSGYTTQRLYVEWNSLPAELRQPYLTSLSLSLSDNSVWR